jgi:hypothetical protein
VLNDWFREVESSNSEPHARLASFREFLFHARQVDPAHPLGIALSLAIKRLEK